MAFSTLTNATMTMESCNVAAANSLSELAQTVKEKGLWIFGESDSKRRLITIEKKDGSYGFTLQSYGVRYKHGNRETDFITYVNAVEKDGAAFYAGLREGDVILSVNGQNMARTEHRSLVSFIRKCPSHLKMVVISDERARKVELHMRYVHLQKKLHDKMKELEQLNRTEREILSGTYKGPTSTSLGDMCFGDDISSCCFCPSKSKGFLDDKEKSKSMGSTDKMKDRDSYHYDCYRKSQSTKDLANDPSVIASSSSLKLLCNNFSSSGGELAAVTTNAGASSGTAASSSSKSAQSSSSSRYHPHGSSQVGTQGGNNVQPVSGPPTGEAQNTPKPKSWDNLMTTKSYGGYGFGFGYGYYPSKHGHHHFSHPHHHNHHTHCGSRGHSSGSYYYNNNGGGTQGNSSCSSSRSQTGGSHSSRERRASTDATSANFQQPSAGGQDQSGGTRPFTNYTTYKMIGTTRVVARVTMGNIETAVGSCTRTLPSMRSSSSSRRSHTPDSSSFSSKMEKTLSDSSLNSEHHKDFPKSMSYFSRNSENDSRYSSDDDYDEYATEPNYGGKHDIYV